MTIGTEVSRDVESQLTSTTERAAASGMMSEVNTARLEGAAPLPASDARATDQLPGLNLATSNQDSAFTSNTDGSASHVVKRGDTIWDITRKALEEQAHAQGTEGEISNAAVASAMKDIIQYNLDRRNISDADRIYPGDTIDIPPQFVAQQPQEQPDTPSEVPPSDNAANEGGGHPNADQIAADYFRKGQQYVDANFSQMDADQDNYLTGAEVQSYIEQKGQQLPADTQSYLRTVAEKQSDIEEQSNDEWGDESSGITREDLQGWTQSQIDAVTGVSLNF